MPEPDRQAEHRVREAAYFLWEHEGRPDGRAWNHWLRAESSGHSISSPLDEPMDDEEKVLAGRPDANIPALLTRDVPGG
jgi:hypothetical protein